MMEGMGWSYGKGLGLKENGRLRCEKIRKKEGNKGIGMDETSQNNMMAVNSLYNNMLKRLASTVSNTSNKDIDLEENNVEEIKENEATCNINVNLRIKRYTARHHLYSKFRRAKDVSSYSENERFLLLGTERKKLGKTKSNRKSNAKLVCNLNKMRECGNKSDSSDVSIDNQNSDDNFSNIITKEKITINETDKSHSTKPKNIYEYFQNKLKNKVGIKDEQMEIFNKLKSISVSKNLRASKSGLGYSTEMNRVEKRNSLIESITKKDKFRNKKRSLEDMKTKQFKKDKNLNDIDKIDGDKKGKHKTAKKQKKVKKISINLDEFESNTRKLEKTALKKTKDKKRKKRREEFKDNKIKKKRKKDSI